MLSDLQNIPQVMRRRGWLNGARLLEVWFSRPPAAAPAYGPPDISTIRMDGWALTFQRARTVYDQMIHEHIWSNPAGRVEVAKMLRRKGLLTTAGQTQIFGTLSDPVPLQDPDYINQRAVGDYHTFDDMTAALGRFNFRVVVAGTVASVPQLPGATPLAGSWNVEVEEIGVYVRDSFDFEGNQYLGCWSDDDFIPLMPPSYGEGYAPSEPVCSPVGNRQFREWRSQHGRGGDFLVYSDMKRVSLSPPDRFVIT